MTRSSRRSARPPVDRAGAPPATPHGLGHDSRPIEGAVAGYRVLRRIATGDRADVYLAVVDAHDDVDAHEPDAPAAARPLVALRLYDVSASDDAIATEIEVMASDASGATPALVDVATLDDGRTCVAVERIPGAALTQLLVERTFLAGEAVTLLAPIVQAVRELERRGFVHPRLSAADVLLDERGRPRLVGLGSVRRLEEIPAGPDRVALLREGEAALLRLVEDVAAATHPTGALAGCVAVLTASLARRPFTTCADQLERAIFDVAAPAAIADVAVHERSTAVPARIVPAPVQRVTEQPGLVADPVARTPHAARFRRIASLAQLPEQLVDDVAAAADGASTRALRGHVAAVLSSRRRQLVVAGSSGAAMLAVMLTLVPPGGGAVSVADSEAGPVASAIPSAGAGQPVEIDVPDGVGAEVDPVSAASELLEVRASCLASRDLDCLTAVLQPGSPIAASDRALLLGDGPEGGGLEGEGAEGGAAVGPFDLGAIDLVADMGSAVLLGVPYADAEREPASLLMMRSEAGWRLRELFD